MKSRTANPERPSLDASQRTSWRTWFLHEWGLMILAMVLAVIIWEITSTTVIRELRIEDVRVELLVDEQDREQIGAVLNQPGTTVDLEMTCSERERLALLAALNETGGGSPLLRLHVSPAFNRDSRELSLSADQWLWPVSHADEIGLRAQVPDGMVYKIEGVHQVHIQRPPTIPSEAELRELGYVFELTDPEADPPTRIALDRAFMEFRAPRAMLGSGASGLSMTPDAIDLRSLIAEDAPPLGKQHTFTLSFNGWLAASELSGEAQERVHQYRSRLELKAVTAKLALVRTAALEIENRLEVLLHEDFTWEMSTPMDLPLLTLTPRKFKGTLQGPKDVLDEIKANPGQWVWVIWIAEPPKGWPKPPAMGADDDVKKNVAARIDWLPLRADWKNRGVRFLPAPNSGQDGFTVQVMRRKSGG